MERHWIVVDCRRPGNQLVHASERTFLLLALPVAAASCVSGEEQAKEGGPHLCQRFISFFFSFTSRSRCYYIPSYCSLERPSGGSTLRRRRKNEDKEDESKKKNPPLKNVKNIERKNQKKKKRLFVEQVFTKLFLNFLFTYFFWGGDDGGAPFVHHLYTQFAPQLANALFNFLLQLECFSSRLEKIQNKDKKKNKQTKQKLFL